MDSSEAHRRGFFAAVSHHPCPTLADNRAVFALEPKLVVADEPTIGSGDEDAPDVAPTESQ